MNKLFEKTLFTVQYLISTSNHGLITISSGPMNLRVVLFKHSKLEINKKINIDDSE